MLEPLTIAGTSVESGTTERLEVPVARLFTQQMLSLPVVVVNGAQDGPRLWLTAAIHGDEINGTEVARRVLERVTAPSLRGALVVAPVVNVYGFLERSRYLPDRRDLNRSFPGSPRGSLAAQLAHLIVTEVVSRCTHGIDLHAGSGHRTNLPQARGNFDDPRILAMARAFAAPASIHAALRRGSMRSAAAARDLPCLLYEAGSTMRMDEEPIRCGTEGVLRVMHHLDMIEGHAEAPPTWFSRSTHWIRAPRAGILHLRTAPGDRVAKGAVLGVVRDTFGDVTARVRSRHAGLVIGAAESPLVNRGDAVLHVAERLEGDPG